MFGPNGLLYGTMSSASLPGNTGFTRSVNLSQPDKYDWIQQQTALVTSIPYVPSTAPSIGFKTVGSNFCLTATLNPTQPGGKWVLQSSTTLTTNSWTNLPVEFTYSPSSGRYEQLEPGTGPKQFYRFIWQSD